MSFTLATWNINSVRLREPIVLQLLREEAPDVICNIYNHGQSFRQLRIIFNT